MAAVTPSLIKMSDLGLLHHAVVSQTLTDITFTYTHWSARLWEEVAGSLFVVLDIIRSVADGRSGICIRSACICGQRAHARGHSDSGASARKGIFAHQCTGRETEPVCPRLFSGSHWLSELTHTASVHTTALCTTDRPLLK